MHILHVTSDKLDQQTIADIEIFCQKCELETSQPAYDNMSFTNWENKTNTLLYLLLKTTQFSKENGIFSFIYNDNNEIIASCGAYKSEFDSNVVIGGVRSWKLPKFRGLPDIATKIMPYHYDWAIQNNAKIFILTFNEYNKKMMRVLHRSGEFQGKQFLKFGEKPSDFYPSMDVLPFMIRVKNVMQHVLYKKIDPNYQPKWPVE